MDTRHRIEINTTEGSSCYAVVLYFSKNQANSQKPKISSNINEVIKTV